MNITLGPDLEKRIAEKIERGDVETADAFVEEALNFYLAYESGGMEEAEMQAAIDEALDQGSRGEGRPAEEVFANLRAKHGISR
jgi:Arc/MetJ-type ribon-helix-helix transcriptional regulator